MGQIPTKCNFINIVEITEDHYGQEVQAVEVTCCYKQQDGDYSDLHGGVLCETYDIIYAVKKAYGLGFKKGQTR